MDVADRAHEGSPRKDPEAAETTPKMSHDSET